MNKFQLRNRLSALSIAAALVVFSGQAQAAVTQYTDLPTFSSALTSAGLVGTVYGFPSGSFPGVVDPESLTTGPATFSGQNIDNAASFFVSDGSYGFTTPFYSHEMFDPSGGNSVLITFATPTRGFSFNSNVMNPPIGDEINPYNWPTSGNVSLTLTTNTGTAINMFSPTFSNYWSDPTIVPPIAFNGIVSDTAFTSVTLSVVQGENLQLTSFMLAPVPEPETYAMLLAGIGLIGALVKRRKIA
jgi:hypothetical protein